LALGAALVVCGCATSVIQNDRLARFEPEKGYRFRNLEPGEQNSDSLLVILTFSGGGTRAASLAYGTLEALRDTRITWGGHESSLLDEVDVISSVSGGSLTAAYYGLFGERIFDEFPERVLYRNIQNGLIKQLFSPRTTIMMASPFYTRTDILADGFDRDIFERKTFGDLQAKGRRPYIVINSTDMSLGSRFEFTQDQFDHLYSELSTYRIGHAVAASAAFPGAFPPITLRNFDHGADYALPEWAQQALASEDFTRPGYRQAENLARYSEPSRDFVHLTDGGVADNLGLLPVIQVLRRVKAGSSQTLGEMVQNVRKILIITVNAEAKPPRSWDMSQSPLGVVATLLMAGSTPLTNFTSAEIEYMKLLIENQRLRAEVAKQEGDSASGKIPDLHFVEVSFDYVKDPVEREALNQLPTSFKLKRDQVDRLRTAAGTVLRDHPDFAKFLEGVRSQESVVGMEEKEGSRSAE